YNRHEYRDCLFLHNTCNNQYIPHNPQMRQMGKKLEDTEDDLQEEKASEYVTPGGDDQRKDKNKDKDKDSTGMTNTLDRTKENRLLHDPGHKDDDDDDNGEDAGGVSVDEASDTAEPLNKTSLPMVFIPRNDQEKVKYMKKAAQEFGYSNLKLAELVLSKRGRAKKRRRMAMMMMIMKIKIKMKCKKRKRCPQRNGKKKNKSS
ncbi:hypothetical protein RFI_35434, partial [Reticulomyxa filosa]